MFRFYGKPTTIVTVTHLASYEDDIVEYIQSKLSFLGNIRTRGYSIPQAGGGTNLELIIDFIGVAAASGIIGQLAVSLFQKIGKALFELHDYNKDTYPLLDFDNITFRYDDVELSIAFISVDTIKDLPDIIKEVHELMVTLSEEPPHRIIFPIYFNGHDFSSYPISGHGEPSGYPYRYWLIKVNDVSASASRIYDRKRKAVYDIEIHEKTITSIQSDDTQYDSDEDFIEKLLMDQQGFEIP